MEAATGCKAFPTIASMLESDGAYGDLRSKPLDEARWAIHANDRGIYMEFRYSDENRVAKEPPTMPLKVGRGIGNISYFLPYGSSLNQTHG